ncbi:MAG: hypothetical protein IJG56_03265 [Clostridia bacterium]|nr:hypothetical protein [Clostridia bacterium]
MKQGKKTISFYWAVLLIAALSLSAYGLYQGIVLPNSAELQLRQGLRQLEKAAASGETEALEKTLAMMDEETLLRTIAEAALEGEEKGDVTALAFFGPAAVERIGPGVSPEQLGEILCEEEYPASFRAFLLEITLYAHAEEKEGFLFPGGEYTDRLRGLIEEDAIQNDVVLEYAMISVPWEENSATLQRIYETRADNPYIQGRALELMAQYDPERATNELFAMAEGNKWIGMGSEALKSYFISLNSLRSPEAAEEALRTTTAMLQHIDKLKDVSRIGTAIHHTGCLMGRLHMRGLPLLLLEYEDVLSDLPEDILEGTMSVLGSSYLFWEIDELLHSEDPAVVEWALRWVEVYPLQYYIDSLEPIRDQGGPLGEKAAELIERANEELLYMPRTDLATKEGDWEVLNERNRLEHERQREEAMAELAENGRG